MSDKIDIATSVKTAFEYGPFYFAVLLLLTVSTLSGRAYRKISKNQGASADERRAHRNFFVASYALGLFLVAVSVIWWLAYRPKLYAYNVVIRDLRDYETLISDRNVYFQAEITTLIDDDGSQLRKEHILAIQDKPFEPGQRFKVELAKDHKKRGNSEIEYTTEKDPEFFWFYNKDTGGNELHRTQHRGRDAQDGGQQGVFLNSVISSAYAAEERVRAPVRPAERASGVTYPNSAGPLDLRSSSCRSMSVVLDPRAQVGLRIVTIEEILGMSDAAARECVLGSNGAAAVAMLSELSQHSDVELAAKAEALRKKIRWDDFLAQELKSSNKDNRRAAEDAVARLQASDADRILQRAGIAKDSRGTQLAEKVTSRAGVPIPSGGNRDRYYVKASWDPARADVVECLTKLFNHELISRRTLEDEKRLMLNRRERIVYWYEPDWAVHISQEIVACGGKASYVSY